MHPAVVELANKLKVAILTPKEVAEAALKHIAEVEDALKHSTAHIKVLQEQGAIFKDRRNPRNKYDRRILPNMHVDVYDVLNAFEVWKPEVAHAVKKLLAAGKLGDKSLLQDLQEAQASIEAAVRREEVNNVDPKRAE